MTRHSSSHLLVGPFSDVRSKLLTLPLLPRFACNKFLTLNSSHNLEQKVEWMYAFDVHCNSFFPFFLITYIAQYLLLPLLLTEGRFAALLSNTMYFLAFSIYFYYTFLGYNGK